MMNANPVNSLVFVIDDDASVRKGLSRLLRSASYEHEVFDSANAFLNRERHRGPSCVIVDVRMPGGGGGFDLQETLLRRHRQEQLIFMTGYGDIPMCARAMKAGAIDFLTKPLQHEKLLDCVQHALLRSDLSQRQAAEKNSARERLDRLTPREFEVVQFVATGMLNKQIAGELGTAEKTIKVHRGRAMQKLEVQSVPDLLHLLERAQVPLAAGNTTNV